MTKLFRSKAFLGGICLVLAAAIAFLLLPRFYASQSATVSVVRVTQDVPAGKIITSDMLTTAEVGAYGLPEKIVTSEDEAIGKVAAETLYTGEMLWQERLLSEENYLVSEEARTKGLSAGICLVTIELSSTSSGIAGVLRAGYVVDVYVDKLMNYIRYWQASGESLKTSIRTKTRLGQLTEEGHYTGGTVPFGYRAVDKGRINKRSRTVFDLEVDEDEAETVRLIFDKYVNEGLGSQRICRYLHDHGIKHRDGTGFPNTSLNRIIKNIAYTGVIKNGESQSDYIDDLRIISDEVYQQAQEIMRQRTQPHSSVPLNSKGSRRDFHRTHNGRTP